MANEPDWVTRDLQRLANESKLRRQPTEVEWERIWQAATEWAETSGTSPAGAKIDEFVRAHAPGVLADSGRTPPALPTPQYKTIPVPEIELNTGGEAAKWLQELCNDQAKHGWKFYRVDAIPATQKPGCLPCLFGAQATQHLMAVVTFVR